VRDYGPAECERLPTGMVPAIHSLDGPTPSAKARPMSASVETLQNTDAGLRFLSKALPRSRDYVVTWSVLRRVRILAPPPPPTPQGDGAQPRLFLFYLGTELHFFGAFTGSHTPTELLSET